MEEGTTLPSLTPFGVALIQHPCSNPIPLSLLSAVPTAPAQLLVSAFHVHSSSPAWRLLPLPPEGPKVTVRVLEMNIPGRGPGPRVLLPWSYPQPVPNSHILYCSSGSAVQMLPTLNSVCHPWCVMTKSRSMSVVPAFLKSIRIFIVFMLETLEIFFLSGTRCLYFSSSENNSISSLRHSWNLFSGQKFSEKAQVAAVVAASPQTTYLWPEKISNICHKIGVFEWSFVVSF